MCIVLSCDNSRSIAFIETELKVIHFYETDVMKWKYIPAPQALFTYHFIPSIVKCVKRERERPHRNEGCGAALVTHWNFMMWYSMISMTAMNTFLLSHIWRAAVTAFPRE